MAPRALAVVCGLAVASSLLVACGTSCKEIRADRSAFATRVGKRHTADARMLVPFPLLDEAIARHLGAREPVAFDLPVRELGLSLRVSARLERVTTRAERPGKLGVSAEIGLYEGGERIADLTVDGALTPQFRPASAANPRAGLLLALRSADLGRLVPRSTPASRTRLVAWLEKELPRPLRALANDELVGLAADELLAYFGRDLWPDLKGRILGPDHDLFATELALPDLPLAGLTTRSREATPDCQGRGCAPGAMVIDLETSLPVSRDLPSDDPPPRARLITFRLAGETAAELVNLGMDRGELPSRFDGAGKPKPDGKWEARVGWHEGERPLEVHLWDLRDDRCTRARLAGELRAEVKGDELAVEVVDGRVDSVRGPALTEAFAWLDSLWSDALEVVFKVASVAELEVDGRPLALRVRDLTIDARTLTLQLEAR